MRRDAFSSNRRRPSRHAVAAACVALLAVACVKPPGFRAVEGVSTVGATGSQRALRGTPPAPEGASARTAAEVDFETESVAIGSYVRVAVDSFCYPELSGRLVSAGHSPYFVGALLVTAPSDDDDPAAIQMQVEQEFAEQVLVASEAGDHSALPTTMTELAIGSNRCVPQEHFASLPVAIQGSSIRHQPMVTASALWLRALRSHDIEQKLRWAISIARALGSVVGVDIPNSEDLSSLGGVGRATAQLREVMGEIEALRAQAETVALARFSVPLAQPAEAGTRNVLVPASDQQFVYLWDTRERPNATEIARQVAEGKLRQVEERVFRVDAELGCAEGAASCPFTGAYLLWHVETSTNTEFRDTAWDGIGDAADALSRGEEVDLGAFSALSTQGSLRDRLSSPDRQLVGRLTGVLGRAAGAIHPRAGELVSSPCDALDELRELGLERAEAQGVNPAGVPGPVLGQLRGLSGRLQALCGDRACPNAGEVRDDSTGVCRAPVACAAGMQRLVNGHCAPDRSCLAGFVPGGDGCVPAGGSSAAAPATAPPAAAAEGVAATTLESECSGDSAPACNMLGRYHRLGYGGVAQDDARALQLYQAACTANYRPACSNLAFAYAHGVGTPADETRATDLYRRVCESGDAQACANLGARLRRSSASAAFALYQRACDEGATSGCRGLAYMWFTGCEPGGDNTGEPFCRSVGRDERLDIAASLYSEACSTGDGDACSDLAVLVNASQGRAALPRVQGLLYQACSMGSPNGCFSYASLLASRGQTDDATRLRTWACAQNDAPEACR